MSLEDTVKLLSSMFATLVGIAPPVLLAFFVLPLLAVDLEGTGTFIASITGAVVALGGLWQANKAANRAEKAATASKIVVEETKQLHQTVNSQLSKFSDAEAKRGDAEGYLRATIENIITARELLAANKAEEAARLLLASVEKAAKDAGVLEGLAKAEGTVIPPQPGQVPTPGMTIPVQLGEGLGTEQKPMQVEVVQQEGGPVPVKVVKPEEEDMS